MNARCHTPYPVYVRAAALPWVSQPARQVPLFMPSLLRSLWADDSGQGLVEYALIIALVAVGLIAILLVLRNSIGNVFNNAATQLNNAPTNPYP